MEDIQKVWDPLLEKLQKHFKAKEGDAGKGN
jgi:hypothetical protein